MSDVSLTAFLISLGSALGGAVVLVVGVHLVGRLVARRWRSADLLVRDTRLPFRVFVVVAAVGAVVGSAHPRAVPVGWWHDLQLVHRLVTIGATAWLVAAVLLFVEDVALGRYRVDVSDNRAARRMRTQILVLRRLTIAVVTVLALGAALLSLPGVRALGASLLASAGLISVVAAVAAQSTLSNVFAGISVAFSDSIRLGDVVIVEEEWGHIEEITLSYVVVHLWDDRRMVLPSTYFTTKPFQNWTRRTSQLLGTVELDVDWAVDVDALRAVLDRVLHGTDLWDGRAQNLQVTDATCGVVRLRALVTAANAGNLWDLRCLVRERMVTWLRERGYGLPRERVELLPAEDRTGAGDSVDRLTGRR